MKINREELLTCLETVRPGLSTQDIVEQSSCFAFRDGRVFTYNDEIYCSCQCDVDFEGAVAATPLISLLTKMTEEEIIIEATETELRIRGRRRRAGIRMETEILLTDIRIPKSEDRWGKLPTEFCEAVDIVRRCAGTDDSIFSLTCVHITPDFVEAFDNAQVSRYPLKIDMKRPILVHNAALLHVGSSTVSEWSHSKSWLHFRNTEGLVISCRLYIEDFPSLDKIINMKGTKVVLPDKLTEAVSIAEIFSTTSDENEVKITLKPSQMTVRGEGDTGWFNERKKIKYKGPEMTFNIAPRMIQEVMKRRHECEIGDGLLKIDGGKFVYVTCLDMMEGDDGNDT